MQEESKDRRQLLLNKVRANLTQLPLLTTKRSNLMAKNHTKQKSFLGGDLQNHFSESQGQDQSEVKLENKEQFLEKYELLEKIGEGTNGVVKKCRHKKKDIIFAVKVIKLSSQHCLELKKNFRFMKALFHKNIVSYQAIYLDLSKSKCYLIMDYQPMPSLAKAKNLTEEEIKEIMKQLFSVLEYIHSKNICHRDIKPGNILYDRFSQKIKLIDFGISKKVVERGHQKELLTITGQLYYRAPEMFLMGGYNENVDLWAAGITLYKLITGKTPFESQYVSDTIERITQEKIYFEGEVWSKYNHLVKDLVSRLLTKNKQARLTAEQGKDHFWLNEKNQQIEFYKSDSYQFQRKKQSIHKKNIQVEEKHEEPIIHASQKIISFEDVHEENEDDNIWLSSENEDMIVEVTESGDQLVSPSSFTPMKLRPKSQSFNL